MEFPAEVAVMHRVAIALALLLALAGCGLVRLQGEPVQLLTGVDGCWAGGETGVRSSLVVDPEFGTRFDGRPVMWPVGFTGVLVGGQVQILDVGGSVVASTGKDYYLSYAPVLDPERKALMERLNAFPVAANCGYLWDLVDCGPPDTGSVYCKPPRFPGARPG